MNGSLGEVVHAADLRRRHAVLLHPLAIEGHVLVGPADRLPQPLRLQAPQLLARDVVGAAGRMERGRRVRNGRGGVTHPDAPCATRHFPWGLRPD